jgi:hypothetical protein
MERRFITEEEIENKRTKNGGFTKRVAASWGVPWPLPSGWKKWILKYGIPYDGIEIERANKDQRAQPRKEIKA